MSMQAIIIDHFGSPDDAFVYKTVPKPTVPVGEALISIKALGINPAEAHMRAGEWDESNPISGIECVGVVEECPGQEFVIGSRVAAVMGGMGRSRPGSYAEYVAAPVSNIVGLESSLPWEELAALPEIYSTAYSSLFTVLDLQPKDRLLIRGTTSNIGTAALHLAVDAGAIVTATTRRVEMIDTLRTAGAQDVLLEGEIGSQIGKIVKFDKTLNLVGNSVLLESISLTRAGGRMLQAGWLGGLAPVKEFNPMVQMESGVHFSLFHTKTLGSPEFPMSGIPLQEIAQKIEKGAWDAKPARVFHFSEMPEAHKLLEAEIAGGKIVVRHGMHG